MIFFKVITCFGLFFQINLVMKKILNIGLIGSGFMGKAHANAFRNVSSFFNDLKFEPVLHTIADANKKLGERAKMNLGFQMIYIQALYHLDKLQKIQGWAQV